MTPEGYVKTACLDLLAAERIWHRRFNTGAHVIPETESSARRFITYGSPGMADILAAPVIRKSFAVTNSTFVSAEIPVLLWIETKDRKGSQREHQKEFQAEVEAAGHYYLLARSSDDILAWLDEHCEMRKARKANCRV